MGSKRAPGGGPAIGGSDKEREVSGDKDYSKSHHPTVVIATNAAAAAHAKDGMAGPHHHAASAADSKGAAATVRAATANATAKGPGGGDAGHAAKGAKVGLQVVAPDVVHVPRLVSPARMLRRCSTEKCSLGRVSCSRRFFLWKEGDA